MSASHRIDILDGLRAVAIMAVLLYHYFVKFADPGGPDPYPYAAAYAGVSIAKYGFMGVQLFFVVSGFVIAMTLARCTTISEFYLRRFARLWPPLLVCAIITFAALNVIDTNFAQQRRAMMLDLIPSLTLTSPKIWLWLNHNIRYVDGAYWSLFVEARFYIYAAIIYRWSAKGKFLRNYIIFSMTAVAIATLYRALLQDDRWYLIIDGLFYPAHTLWFAAGILFYEVWTGHIRLKKAIGLLTLGFVPLVYMLRTFHPDISVVPLATMSLIILLLFVVFSVRPEWLAPLRFRAVLWMGTISYSVYLLHQNVGLGLISLIPQRLPWWMQLGLVAAVSAAILLLSSVVYVLIEQRGKAMVLRHLLRSPPVGLQM
ncbi:acyltransferase family protein [Dongia soli]|uniref:Acyltransferase n=1 Tax=Dongia soli TaxID=600628 RepID=A0ABU5EB34_9PROT|nr:acyltransferase [Dongia soli]MDY0883102.1 acyltransferase [Dongia soli]